MTAAERAKCWRQRRLVSRCASTPAPEYGQLAREHGRGAMRRGWRLAQRPAAGSPSAPSPWPKAPHARTLSSLTLEFTDARCSETVPLAPERSARGDYLLDSREHTEQHTVRSLPSSQSNIASEYAPLGHLLNALTIGCGKTRDPMSAQRKTDNGKMSNFMAKGERTMRGMARLDPEKSAFGRARQADMCCQDAHGGQFLSQLL